MKKLLLTAAALTAFSAPAFAQSINDGAGRSLHEAVDYSALTVSQDGTPVGLLILEAELQYKTYNDYSPRAGLYWSIWTDRLK